MAGYALGLDFGTNSVRALVADVADGRELGGYVHDYTRGEAGILLSRERPAPIVWLGALLVLAGALLAAW